MLKASVRRAHLLPAMAQLPGAPGTRRDYLAVAPARLLVGCCCPVPSAGSSTGKPGSLVSAGPTIRHMYNLRGWPGQPQSFDLQQARFATETRHGAGRYLVRAAWRAHLASK